MKQLVALESTSAFVLAIALLVLIEMGMCMDQNRVVTITELNLWTALTQADGFRHSENPLFQQGLSSLVLAHLLPLWPFLEAMNWLVLGEFGCSFVLSLGVLHHIRFYRQLLLLTLDWDAGSSYVDHCCLVCSMYAGDNCNSDAPFCDMCNTQLRVGLLSFLLCALFAYILLWVHTLLEAWLWDPFLRFLRYDPWFFWLMYPWHLGRSTFIVASTPLGVR